MRTDLTIGTHCCTCECLSRYSFLYEFLAILKEVKTENIPLVFERKLWLNFNLSEDNCEFFCTLYYMLEDDNSKRVFKTILRNSLGIALSRDRNKFCFVTNSKWTELNKKATSLNVPFDSYQLDIIETCLLEGYRYNSICCAKNGDVVLDCGAFTGLTASYFSERTGTNGQVHAFEAMPQNFDLLKTNIAKLSKDNIFCHHYAISDKIAKLKFTPIASEASSETQGAKYIEVESISIDEFVKLHGIKRVDFIKMDIEGGELKGLKGAMETCQKWHPTLAICIYHRHTDWIDIPKQILAIDKNYHFYLKHNSNWFHETVLFAKWEDTDTLVPDTFMESRIVSQIWKSLSTMLESTQRRQRQLLLESYIARMESLTRLHHNWKLDVNDYMWAYLPLSQDDRLHFEFWFNVDGLHVTLHFEGQWQDRDQVVADICAADCLERKLQNVKWPIKGCAYICDPYDCQQVANRMAHLMKLALPVLKKNLLIKDDVYMDVAASIL